MILHQPFQISARLLPAIRIGDDWISIEFDGESQGRARYRYHIDFGKEYHQGNDLKSGVGGGSLQQGMASLLSFLSACAESYNCKGENYDLFPPHVAEWAYQNSDEISMLQCELEETPNLITP
jgi:hypothetical protein